MADKLCRARTAPVHDPHGGPGHERRYDRIFPELWCI